MKPIHTHFNRTVEMYGNELEIGVHVHADESEDGYHIDLEIETDEDMKDWINIRMKHMDVSTARFLLNELLRGIDAAAMITAPGGPYQGPIPACPPPTALLNR